MSSDVWEAITASPSRSSYTGERPHVPLLGFPEEFIERHMYFCRPRPNLVGAAWRTIAGNRRAYRVSVVRCTPGMDTLHAWAAQVDPVWTFCSDLLEVSCLLHHLIATHGGNTPCNHLMPSTPSQPLSELITHPLATTASLLKSVG